MIGATCSENVTGSLAALVGRERVATAAAIPAPERTSPTIDRLHDVGRSLRAINLQRQQDYLTCIRLSPERGSFALCASASSRPSTMSRCDSRPSASCTDRRASKCNGYFLARKLTLLACTE